MFVNDKCSWLTHSHSLLIYPSIHFCPGACPSHLFWMIWLSLKKQAVIVNRFLRANTLSLTLAVLFLDISMWLKQQAQDSRNENRLHTDIMGYKWLLLLCAQLCNIEIQLPCALCPTSVGVFHFPLCSRDFFTAKIAHGVHGLTDTFVRLCSLNDSKLFSWSSYWSFTKQWRNGEVLAK